MTNELILALMMFAFVSSITPGPNNLMLMASGANFGFQRTIPHMLGVGLGFTLMVMLVGLGLSQVFEQYPICYDLLKVVSVVYMTYLAIKIAATKQTDESTRQRTQPLTFIQAALFQWVNPKGWAMALTAVSVYTPGTGGWDAVIWVAVAFGIVNLPSVSFWAVLGQKLSYFLTSPLRFRAFNITMSILLMGSLYPVLLTA